MAQQKIAAALLVFLIAIGLLMYIGRKRKRALVLLTVLEDIEKARRK